MKVDDSEYDRLSDIDILEKESQSTQTNESEKTKLNEFFTSNEFENNTNNLRQNFFSRSTQTNSLKDGKHMIDLRNHGLEIIFPRLQYIVHGYKLSDSGFFYSTDEPNVHFNVQVGNCNTEIIYNKETGNTNIIQKKVPITKLEYGRDENRNLLPDFRINDFGLVEKRPSLFRLIGTSLSNGIGFIFNRFGDAYDVSFGKMSKYMISPFTAMLWGAAFTFFYIGTSEKYKFCPDDHLLCNLRSILSLVFKGSVYFIYYPVTIPLMFFSPNSFDYWLTN